MVECSALSHFARGLWVQTSLGSRDFFTTSTYPCRDGCPMGGKKTPSAKTSPAGGQYAKKQHFPPNCRRVGSSVVAEQRLMSILCLPMI